MSAVRCIAPRVADVLGPGVSSSQIACDSCEAPVWVPVRLALAEPGMAVICKRCAGNEGSGNGQPA